jgi:hypothetical protein
MESWQTVEETSGYVRQYDDDDDKEDDDDDDDDV